MEEQNKNDRSKTKGIMSTVIKKGDSIVAISGLFANAGVFGITLGEMKSVAGTVLYVIIILVAVIVAYGLWNFKSWGWLITVIFSVSCILLVLPRILNYHAALVSMILLAYIIQPSVREKYTG